MDGVAANNACVRVRVSTCPSAVLRAGLDEVFAWVVDLARPPISFAELYSRLTTEEQLRAKRYKVAKAREQFVIGRGLLRSVLAERLGVDPQGVPLTYLPSGKPVLENQPICSPVHFNVTHTDGIAVLVFGPRRVGVDVERVRPVLDADGLVSRYFSAAEVAAYRALPAEDRPAAFFRGWTSKEAVIKAAGATVGCLADFDVELNPAMPPRVNAVRLPALGGGWALAEWGAFGSATTALAVEGANTIQLEMV